MTTSDQPNFKSLKHSMARGAAWMIGTRWVIRAVGLINTIVLARLLIPQDFGLVALATVVIGLLDSMTQFNVDLALLRSRSVERSYYDSAWTLQAVTGALKGILYAGVAPLLAAYYGDPRVETIAYIIALRPVIEGLENIGQVEFRRELQFDREFRYWVYRRLLSFLLTIAIVLWLRNYLALALAAPVSATVTVFLSYVMSTYRPRFSMRHIGEIWTFSKWWMLMQTMRYFGGRGEAFIFGGLATPQVIGAYTVGADLSAHVTEDFTGPIGRALVPTFTKIQSATQLLRVFQLTFSLLATFSLAAGVGASLVADDLVLVLLGAKWAIAAPFVRFLAIHSAFWSVVQSMLPYFLVIKRERLFALCNTAYVAALIPTIVTIAHVADVQTVALARATVTGVFLLGMLGVLLSLQIFALSQLVNFLWRPVVATAAMAICVSSVNLSAGPIVVLSLRVATGLGVFSLVLMVLWGLSGRPDGIETAIITLLSDFTRGALSRVRRVKTAFEK